MNNSRKFSMARLFMSNNKWRHRKARSKRRRQLSRRRTRMS